MSLEQLHQKREELIAQIFEQKKQIVDRALKKRGIELDLEAEAKKRFCNLMSETDAENRETWYYNDGSDNGLMVAVFWLAMEGEEGKEQFGLKYKVLC